MWGTANNSGDGTGSGCSSSEPKPSWQHDTGCTHRTINDISAVADPNTGVAVYDAAAGGWLVMGGTSAASPLVASIYALTGHASVSPSFPYSNPGDQYDVTTAANGTCGSYLCTAAAGYDGPTGLGTPNGMAMSGGGPAVSDFSIAVTPSSSSVVAGGGASATVKTTTVSGATEGVTLSASGLPAGATATFSPTSVTSGSSATLSISTSVSTPKGSYLVTVTGSAVSGRHTASYTLTVGTTATCSGQKLANPGFESGNASWSGTGGVIGQNAPTQPTHSGTWDAWLDGYGTTHTDRLSQTVTIPAACKNYTLSFFLHVDTAETATIVKLDTLTVQLGSTRLATYSNLDKGTGYSYKTFNIASLAGQTLALTFTGSEDASRQTSFVIDDTALTVS